MSKRDNDYYARQLQRNHPQIWHDFQTGVHETIAEARRAAGLGGERTRLHELKNAWSKATDEQRDEFLDFLDAEGVKLTKATPDLISSADRLHGAASALDQTAARDDQQCLTQLVCVPICRSS